MPRKPDLPTVIIGSDHAGYGTKQAIIAALAKKGYTIVDIGDFSEKEGDDYPVFAERVAREVASDRTGSARGILICGSGTGMVIAANKIPGARAAFAFDAYGARMARHDNDANILALRGRSFPKKKAAALAAVFLAAEFSGLARHKRRIRAIHSLERKA